MEKSKPDPLEPQTLSKTLTSKWLAGRGHFKGTGRLWELPSTPPHSCSPSKASGWDG